MALTVVGQTLSRPPLVSLTQQVPGSTRKNPSQQFLPPPKKKNYSIFVKVTIVISSCRWMYQCINFLGI